MAPTRTKKQAAPADVTPPKRQRSIAISEGQKQALIDNLRLEVTARARKLRAQYALQAQGLRTRIEIRVNRIPLSLRKANMQALMEKYAAEAEEKEDVVAKMSSAAQPTAASKATQGPVSKIKKAAQTATTTGKRGVKRTSDELEPSPDQENAPQHDLSIPKKRIKTTTASTAAIRATSTTTNAKPKHLADSQILSPKSSNARTIPVSPFRSAMASPSKSKLAGPVTSPSKPAANIGATRTARTLNGMVEKAKTTRTKAVRKVTPGSKTKTTNSTTTTTTTTTAVAAAPVGGVAAKGKRGAQTTVSETTVKKKSAATKKPDALPTAERRVLRKRA